jgi:hypothetical protein
MKKLILIFLVASIAACSPSKHTVSSQSTTQTPSNPNADGSSYEKAIVIQDKSETTGVAAEYKWIRDNYPGSESQGQALMNNNSKPYDVITIKTSDGTIKKIYFDISNFFGKF